MRMTILSGAVLLLSSLSPGFADDDWRFRGNAAADYSAALCGRALLVMVDGQVVYERYDNGWSAERAHPLASGTKSFSGVLAAAAIRLRLAGAIDTVGPPGCAFAKHAPAAARLQMRALK